MENAAEALKMAAFVLIFVLTLTITIASFSEARQVSQRLIEYQDKTYDYTYIDSYKDSDGKIITERIVGAESIIPTIYRSFLENYKVYFLDENGRALTLYTKKINGNPVNINYVDLESDDIVSFANDDQKEKFILAVLFGKKYINFDECDNYYRTNYKITLQKDGLCDIIFNGRKFKEELGEYYQEDLKKYEENSESSTPNEDDNNSQSTIPEINKVKKRIITYTQTPVN